jgi:hypothetical protein
VKKAGAAPPGLPLGSHNFRVSVGSGRDAVEVGCTRVDLPRLVAAGGAAADDSPLVLRRGFDGGMLFAEWWQQHQGAARTPKGRVVTIDLLDGAGREVGLRWRFANCRPTALQHSALDATVPAVLIESLALAFDGVELSR